MDANSGLKFGCKNEYLGFGIPSTRKNSNVVEKRDENFNGGVNSITQHFKMIFKMKIFKRIVNILLI